LKVEMFLPAANIFKIRNALALQRNSI